MIGRIAGARVLFTRRRKDSERIAGMVEELGGIVSIVPMTRIGPPGDPDAVDVARRAVCDFDWIAVTSRHGAIGFLGGLPVPRSRRPGIAAVGGATADSVRGASWPVDLLASGRGAESLAEEMIRAADVRGARVLHPCSDLARTDLKRRLEAAGAAVVALETYRTLPHASAADLLEERDRKGPWDVAVFASPSAVTRFVEVSGDRSEVMSEQVGVAIGPSTALALEEAGGWLVVESETRDDEGLLEAIGRALETGEKTRGRRR